MEIISKFMIVEAAILSASFVFACPTLANEQTLKGNPLNSFFQSPPSVARVTPRAGFKPFHYPLNSVGDFPLPQLNFPREIKQHYKVAPSLLN